ncbi:MAG: acyl-CoA dehydrogenase [Bacteroidota bacterium]
MNPSPSSPNGQFFLPLLYLAWSDEMLSPSEVQMIEQRIQQEAWLSEEEQQWISSKLDPANPPEVHEVKSWLRQIKQLAEQVSEVERRSLLKLSDRIANLGTEHLPGTYKNEAATHALLEIEQALGLGDQDAAKTMLAPKRSSLDPVETAPTQLWEVESLTTWLDGPHKELKDQVRVLLSDPAFGYDRIPENKEAFRELVLEWLQHLADRGYGALSYPTSAGGSGDMGQYFAVFEMLGHHDLSLLVKYGVQFGLFGGSILELGTERHHQTYLPLAGSLELPGCFAMTESGHGSNVRDLETTAIYDADTQEFVIHTPHDMAFKEYIGNAAAHGKMATVFAQLETQGERHGVHAFLVPIRDESGEAQPGVRIEDSGRKLGLNGVDNGRLWFDQVRIPREHLLNRFADVAMDGTYSSPITNESKRFFTMLGTLVGGRVGVPLAGLSTAKSGLTIAIQYAAKRRQFGRPGDAEMPILDYPSHQRRLMPLLAKTYALHTAHRYVLDRYLTHTPEESREMEALAAGLKAISTWHTTHTLQECREACGGNGYLWVNRLADMKADSDIFTTFEGDNTVLLQLVAKGRLTHFRRSFSALGFMGMVNFLSDQLLTFIREKNPLIKRLQSQEHLRDGEWQLGLFRAREQDLVVSAARRMKRRMDEGMEAYDAFLEVQTHLLSLARAYVDRIVLEQFTLALDTLEDPQHVELLTRLRDLYALSEMEEHLAWYLENGYLEGGKAAAIRQQVDQLCKELRPDAVSLVHAFGIPDALLSAPIAISYGTVPSAG